jgi:hypothetical protein
MGCDRVGGIFNHNGCAWLIIILVIIFFFGFDGFPFGV